MSGFLRTASKIAGVVATVAMFIPGGQPVAAVAGIASVAWGIEAQLLAKKPPAQGSATNITIGANMPSEMILGESYSGGSRVHQVGYGSENDVPNAYLLLVDVYGVGGPYQALVGTYADFSPISFDGSGKAIGYYSNNTLYRDYQLGATPESDALSPHWSGAPDWGSSYKLSGKPAIAWSARFPKDGKRFGSGFFQSGAVWQGIKLYDMRLDSTYPGGSGSQRWADPSNKTAFAAAKPTWSYSSNPGLHALRYALGTWERDETTTDEYRKVFGIGLGWEALVVEDFAELANVCDDNGWACNGVISEPGDKWANLKSILQAGGAEPCFKGGKLGLRINTPRVSLDTITRDDIADGDLTIPGMQSYRDRVNTISPKYRSPDHKWEYVTTQEVIQVTEYVTEDGEEKAQEVQFNLVTDPVQAAQLGAYALVNGREAGPIELPCKPRLRRYSPGDLLDVDLPEAGMEGQYLILQRSIDPETMIVTLTLVSENPDKHDFALSQTGTMPPAVTIASPEDADTVAGSDPNGTSNTIRGAYIVSPGVLSAIDAGSDASINVAEHEWDYPGAAANVTRAAGSVTGLSFVTGYHVYFDDSTLEDTAPTYQATTDIALALNSTAFPYRHYVGAITTPADGGGGTVGGGGGGGYCVTPDTPILMANGTSKRAGEIIPGEFVWTQHERTMAWCNYPVTAAKRVPCPELFAAMIDGKSITGSPDHPVWIDGAWVTLDQIGAPAGSGEVVMLTVADAHTYVANGVLSHNKQVDPPEE